MAHDVFISHSSKDKSVADAVTAKLEQAGYRCWIAPRDILPGDSWSGSIVRAIEKCRILVIIFSAQSNASKQVVREVERAVNSGATVIPMRIDETLPTDDFSYFLGSTHWMDAIGDVLETKLNELVTVVDRVLAKDEAAPPSAQNQNQTETQDNTKQPLLELAEKRRTKNLPIIAAILAALGVGLFLVKGNVFTDSDLGVYESNWGRITFYEQNTRADYPSNDNGRILGKFDQESRTFNGYWIEDEAAQACQSLLEGSLYWGRIKVRFERDLSQFHGNWSYCNEPVDPKRIWQGKK